MENLLGGPEMMPRFFSAAVGVWLTAAPAVLGYGGSAAVNDRVAGPLTVTFAVIAMWEVTRSLRWMNFFIALWLAFAPLHFSFPPDAALNCLLCGFALAVLSMRGDGIRTRFGGGWSGLWKS